VEQVAFADRLLLNKCDLVDDKDLERVEKRLKSINANAPILRCTKSEVSVESVLNIQGFDLKRTLEMDPEFLNTDGEHEHDASVSSVSIVQTGDIDLDLIQAWISDLLQNKGTDIYRMKGVLSIAYADKRFVYQAVHMIFNGDFTDAWEEDEERESKLVFIGKNLNREELKASFAACLMNEESKQKKLKSLRFAIGAAVKCNVGGGTWARGKVVALMYREDHMPPGMVAPYQVKLDDGSDIYAPADEDDFIRAA